MASFLRAKQSGIETDLSAGLRSDLFAIDQLSRLGISSQISALAIDPVQSLLAVGTRTTQTNPGQVYIFGQKRVCVVLPLGPGGASVDVLQFARDCLICLDSKHNLNIYSLRERKLLGTFSAPGVVTAICTDPSLDYCLLGLNTGDVIGYDIDRLCLTRFRIPNLWHEIDPRARMTPVVSLQFHPRDLGQLLCGYSAGAAIYSFKENKALRHYQVLPQASQRGMSAPHGRLTHARWHPSGTFILTAHEESSAIITIWDVLKDGRPITRLDLGMPILRSISWCANGTNPDDTGLFIAGTNKLLWRSFGPTPIYATSSYESLGAFFNSPKDVRELPIPPGAEIAEYCLIPRSSPWFAGASDPLAVLLLLDTGEMLTLSFPSGIPISPTNQLPLALSFVHPFLNNFSVTAVERERWLGLRESRSQGPLLVKGGVEAPHNMMRYEKRNVVAAAHGDGLVRLWDMGHGDELENDAVIQCDVARATGRTDRVGITQTSLSAESCELAVGTHEGEVLVFRWGRSRGGREQAGNRPRQLTPIDGRVDPTLKEGMLPLTLLDQQNGPVTAIKTSDVGFVAAAFGGSELVLIDLRGPAIILQTSVKEFAQDKGRSKRKASLQGSDSDYGTQLEFSVMTLEGDSWSSILLHCGTHGGHLGTYRIIPDPSGRYSCQFVSSVFLESKIIYMHAINNAHGRAAAASQQAVAALRSGERTDGSLVAVTATAVHILKPGSTRTGAHKSFSDAFCDAAGVGRYQDRGHAVIAMLGDSTARAYSIPALKELAVLRLNGLDIRRFKDAKITSAGNIVAFSSPSELSLLGVFGTGAPFIATADTLWNPALLLPPRPTVSMVSWVTGTQYVTPLDLDTLIGGPGRPPSKRAIEQAQSEDAQRRAGTVPAGQGAPEGYLAYAQRQLTERTANMNIVGDSMNSLQEASTTWLNDVNKYVSSSKKAAATGIIKARFGL